MPLEMKSVYSSHVSQIGHDPETGELHVVYRNGRRSVYAGVPEEVAEKVMPSAAPSIGTALHDHIRGKYKHRYGEDASDG